MYGWTLYKHRGIRNPTPHWMIRILAPPRYNRDAIFNTKSRLPSPPNCQQHPCRFCQFLKMLSILLYILVAPLALSPVAGSNLVVRQTPTRPFLLHPNGDASKCLDVRGAVFANGTPVQMYVAIPIPVRIPFFDSSRFSMGQQLRLQQHSCAEMAHQHGGGYQSSGVWHELLS